MKYPEYVEICRFCFRIDGKIGCMYYLQSHDCCETDYKKCKGLRYIREVKRARKV